MEEIKVRAELLKEVKKKIRVQQYNQRYYTNNQDNLKAKARERKQSPKMRSVDISKANLQARLQQLEQTTTNCVQ